MVPFINAKRQTLNLGPWSFAGDSPRVHSTDDVPPPVRRRSLRCKCPSLQVLNLTRKRLSLQASTLFSWATEITTQLDHSRNRKALVFLILLRQKRIIRIFTDMMSQRHSGQIALGDWRNFNPFELFSNRFVLCRGWGCCHDKAQARLRWQISLLRYTKCVFSCH